MCFQTSLPAVQPCFIKAGYRVIAPTTGYRAHRLVIEPTDQPCFTKNGYRVYRPSPFNSVLILIVMRGIFLSNSVKSFLNAEKYVIISKYYLRNIHCYQAILIFIHFMMSC